MIRKKVCSGFPKGSGADKKSRLRLALGCGDDEPVEFIADLDLARQPRIGPHVETEIEHVLLHRRGRADLLAPGFVDIDMAGCARAGTAAFRLDAWNGIANCRFHDGGAVLDLDSAGFAVMVDKVDLGHVFSCCPMKRFGQSYNGSVCRALGIDAADGAGLAAFWAGRPRVRIRARRAALRSRCAPQSPPRTARRTAGPDLRRGGPLPRARPRGQRRETRRSPAPSLSRCATTRRLRPGCL